VIGEKPWERQVFLFVPARPLPALEDDHVVEQVGMDLMSMSRSKRFIAGCSIAWRTVIAFLLFGKLWLGELGSMPKSAAFFLWLFAVILWCAFGVVDEADHLAEFRGNLSHPGFDTLNNRNHSHGPRSVLDVRKVHSPPTVTVA
jgi:hypothetical protein